MGKRERSLKRTRNGTPTPRPVLDCYVGALPGNWDEPLPQSDCGDAEVDAILNKLWRL